MPATPDTDRVLRFQFDGVEYVAKPNEVTPNLARECRTATGYSPMQLMQLPFDIDTFAAWWWLARRQAGEPATRQDGRRTVSLWDGICAALTGYDVLERVQMTDGRDTIDPET